jgi:hypothetical protein
MACENCGAFKDNGASDYQGGAHGIFSYRYSLPDCTSRKSEKARRKSREFEAITSYSTRGFMHLNVVPAKTPA